MSDVLTDKECADMLGIATRTLRNHLKHGPPGNSKAGDIRSIRRFRVGKRRRWLRESVEAYRNKSQ